MKESEVNSIVESLIFTSPHPITLNQLEEIVDIKKETLEKVLEAIRMHYAHEERGIRLVEVNEGFHFRTPSTNAPWVQKTVDAKPVRLSSANLEVLAIVAYKQPVTRAEIESLRGVDSSHILKTLMDKGLVQMDGKTDDPGRPILYSTTAAFLEMFSLKSIRELPTLKDMDELSAFGETASNASDLAEAAKDMMVRDLDPEDIGISSFKESDTKAACESEVTS